MNTLDDVDDQDEQTEREQAKTIQADPTPETTPTHLPAIIPAIVKAPEAAKILGMHEGNVRKLAVEGKLPGVKKGRSWVFKLQDVFKLKQARDKALDPR